MYSIPPKVVLVPFDFSERSFLAWRYAVELKERLRCRLEAVYVEPFFFVSETVVPPSLSPGRRREIEAKMRRSLPEAAAAHVVEGDVEFRILETARRRKADLIVMATEGLTGLRRLKRESVTESIVRSSEVPVLSVRDETATPRSIMAPLNLRPYSVQGAAAAQALGRALKVPVLLFHVAEPDDQAAAPFRRLTALVSGENARVKVVEGRSMEKILDEAPRHDLVVLVVHRKGVLRDALLGTTAEQVLRRSLTPVLSIPAEPLQAQRRHVRRAPAKKLHSAHASRGRSGALGRDRRGVVRRVHRRLARR